MANYFLATTGSDGPGTPGTIGSPFLTFQYAVGSVLVAGDTLDVRTGTYTGTSNIIDSALYTVPNGTDFGSGVITIRAYQSEIVTIRPPDGFNAVRLIQARQYLIFQNLLFDGVNQTLGGQQNGPDGAYTEGGTHHIKFIGCASHHWGANGFHPGDNNGASHDIWWTGGSLHDNGNVAPTNNGYGSYVSGTSYNVTIQDAEIYANNGYGVQVNGGPGLFAVNTVVERCRVHDNRVRFSTGPIGGNTSYGLVTMSSDGTIFRNNLIYANQGGMLLYGEAKNSLYVNNTVTANVGHDGGGEYGIQMQYYGTGNRIANNISYANANGDFQDDGGGTGTVTLDHNLTTNPLFVNAAGNNYHLQRGSPAINAGATIAAVPTDYDGLIRPQGFAYCIGAYEFQGSSWLVAM